MDETSAIILKNFTKVLDSLKGKQQLQLAQKSLDSFVGANFAGILDFELPEFSALISLESISLYAFKDLSFDLNTPFLGVRSVELLWIAKKIFEYSASFSELQKDFEWNFWRFRCYFIWSFVLNEKSLNLKAETDEVIKYLDSVIDSNECNIFDETRLYYYLEKSTFKSFFFEQTESCLALEKAGKILGINVELDGALGRRTKFQVKSVAQLIVSLKFSNSESLKDVVNTDEEDCCTDLPINCQNTDDTLLESIKLDNVDTTGISLSTKQSAYILALSLRKNHASTELDTEMSIVFVEEVIRQKKNWALQTRALIERSTLERKSARRVERACSQMEIITKLLDNFEQPKLSDKAKANRVKMIYSSNPLAFWKVKTIHAEILKSLGCTSESLLIYESLKMWDDVVRCYKSLDQLEKAERLVRDLIAKDEKNPGYYCLLGDITRNTEYYEKAILISGNRCARAHAALGQLFLCRKQFKEALNHYQQSVKLQPFQIGVWFNLGHCAMCVEDYREGVRAYHRCVTLEPEHFEAWNNLAACYAHLGQKERAQKVVQESIKLNNEDYNVWQNLVLLSIDIGDFKSALVGIKRILDTNKKRKIDELLLEIIVSQTLDNSVKDASNLRKILPEILTRVMARQSINSKLLRLYAELKRPVAESQDLIAWSKYIQLLEKAIQKDMYLSETEENYTARLNSILVLIAAKKAEWKIKNLEDRQVAIQTKLRIQPIIKSIEKVFGEGCVSSNDQNLKDVFKKAIELIQ